MPTRQDIVTDLCRQVSRLIGTANALMERYSRAAEHLDSDRLALEEIRAILNELIEEIATARNSDAYWRKRIEQLVISNWTGDTRRVEHITQQIIGEHLRDGLREQLVMCQNELLSYTHNIQRTKGRIAKQGYPTVEQENQLDDWQREVDRLTESIARIRQELNDKTTIQTTI